MSFNIQIPNCKYQNKNKKVKHKQRVLKTLNQISNRKKCSNELTDNMMSVSIHADTVKIALSFVL